eukprot:CAMPEP_0184858600 /NCGR_PEP_ID=MMETSP0580-20130426/3682_1 /TAXON_ID=1118495 /ORGANISM="Dactyliosolen fragilissimus" /LENGTH=503 /DNA_ID=CAMNT_0027354831 /DNA_START=21 /DNA_END=1528 /DNA_ORIENTATION=+
MATEIGLGDMHEMNSDDISGSRIPRMRNHSREEEHYSSSSSELSMEIEIGDTHQTNSVDSNKSTGLVAVRNHYNEYDDEELKLSHDTYSMMLLSKPVESALPWWFGFFIFSIQLILFLSVIVDQTSNSSGESVIDKIPIYLSVPVEIAQFAAIFLSVIMTYDLIETIQLVSTLILGKDTIAKKRNRRMLAANTEGHKQTTLLCIPILIKFSIAILTLIASFLFIVQSMDTIGLFQNFLGLQTINIIDDKCFELSKRGFFGKILKHKAMDVCKVRFIPAKPNHIQNRPTSDNSQDGDEVKKYKLPMQASLLIFFCLCMVSTWSIVIALQKSGHFYRSKYPSCQIERLQDAGKDYQVRFIGNGKCNGGPYNTIECGFDGGDCTEYRLAYPNCNVLKLYEVGDGKCQEENNSEECGYDGGDCCPESVVNDSKYGDGICDANVLYNSRACEYDNQDCSDHNEIFSQLCYVDDVNKLGDGTCDGGSYASSACKNDGGDCDQCNVSDIS